MLAPAPLPPPPRSTLFPYTTLFRSGVATRQFTYRNNHMQPPTSELYVELTGPDQQVWIWGDAHADNAVRGSAWEDRKSTRLNSSHVAISYAVFCLQTKNKHDYHAAS